MMSDRISSGASQVPALGDFQMPPGSATDPPSGRVFTVIERRLKERYHISIREHVGDVVVAEATGKFDPSMGGAFPSLGGPREKTLPGSVKSGKFLEGKTILQGITFPPRNFQELLELFRVAANSRGQSAFHYRLQLAGTMMPHGFAGWRGRRRALRRGVVCWHWRRSTTAARARRRPASAGSVCRRSGTGC